MSIKVIVLDVDGTLTNSKKEITEKTKEVLINAQRQGIKLILASGRPTTGLTKFAKQLEMDKHHGLLVSFNGSRVIDCQNDEILFNETISFYDCRAVLEHLKKFNVIPMIDKDEYLYVNDVYNCMIQANNKPMNIIEYESRGGNFLLCEKEDLAAFVDFPLNKILVAGDDVYLKEHYQAIMKPFKNQLSCMFTAPVYFEFTAKGIDKAKALDTVLSKMGYCKEQMIAFGDGQNDASMVEYAGIGIAMENAVQELKDIADDITLSNEEDGIAAALLKYIPELT